MQKARLKREKILPNLD